MKEVRAALANGQNVNQRSPSGVSGYCLSSCHHYHDDYYHYQQNHQDHGNRYHYHGEISGLMYAASGNHFDIMELLLLQVFIVISGLIRSLANPFAINLNI